MYPQIKMVYFVFHKRFTAQFEIMTRSNIPVYFTPVVFQRLFLQFIIS